MKKYLDNNNGSRYEVLAMAENATGDNAYLLKTEGNNYVVAIDWDEERKEWAHGHYYMGNYEAAVKNLQEEAARILGAMAI